MDQYTYLITFNDASPRDMSRYADELSSALLKASQDITVQRKRSDPYAQDFGTTLVLILGTPAVATVVNAIINWLKVGRSASLTVKTADSQIMLQNITHKDAVQLTQLFLTQKKES